VNHAKVAPTKVGAASLVTTFGVCPF
jgi:hypothetical protein